MKNEEIDLLLDICCLYRTISREVSGICKLDATSIEDTLARLRSGEYVIKENPDY